MDKVSAVITTYMREPAIVRRAVESVIAQTYEAIEIIVVDDSPEDYVLRTEVQRTISEYPSVVYVKHEVPKGACAARNTGLNKAKGKYIGFLDDDDEWYSNKIEMQLRGFTNDRIALVYCVNDVINDLDGKIRHEKRTLKQGYIFNDLLKENFIGSTSFPLLRTDVLLDIGGFDELMKSSQDYDVWLRLCEKNEVNFINQPLALYHIHAGEQITKNPQKKIEGLERLYEKNKKYLIDNREARWNRIIKIAPFYSMRKERKKALLLWMKALTVMPFKIKDNLRYLYYILKPNNK